MKCLGCVKDLISWELFSFEQSSVHGGWELFSRHREASTSTGGEEGKSNKVKVKILYLTGLRRGRYSFTFDIPHLL